MQAKVNQLEDEVTATMVTAKPALTQLGDTISFIAGRYRVTLQWVRDGAYSVTTEAASTGARVDEWSCSYRSETAARDEARRAALVLGDGSTVEQIAAKWAHAADRAEEMAHRYGTRAAQVRTDELALMRALEPLTARAADAALVYDIRQTLTAAYAA